VRSAQYPYYVHNEHTKALNELEDAGCRREERRALRHDYECVATNTFVLEGYDFNRMSISGRAWSYSNCTGVSWRPKDIESMPTWLTEKWRLRGVFFFIVNAVMTLIVYELVILHGSDAHRIRARTFTDDDGRTVHEFYRVNFMIRPCGLPVTLTMVLTGINFARIILYVVASILFFGKYRTCALVTQHHLNVLTLIYLCFLFHDCVLTLLVATIVNEYDATGGNHKSTLVSSLVAFITMTDVPPPDVFEKYFFPHYCPPDGVWSDSSFLTGCGRLAVATLVAPFMFILWYLRINTSVFAPCCVCCVIHRCLRGRSRDDSPVKRRTSQADNLARSNPWDPTVGFAKNELLCAVYTRAPNAATDEQEDSDQPLCDDGPSGTDGCSRISAARPSGVVV